MAEHDLTNSSDALLLALKSHAPLLRELAQRYISTMSPDEALEHPLKVITQVMNSGIANDVLRMVSALGNDNLRLVLQQAKPGDFTVLAWSHWHHRLGLPTPAS